MPEWFLACDTVRRRSMLRGRAIERVERALAQAAGALRAVVVRAAVVPCGIRCVVRARSLEHVRGVARRMTAIAAGPGCDVRWRPGAFVRRLQPGDVRAALDLVSHCAQMEDRFVAATLRRRPGLGNRAVSVVRAIDRTIDAALGADESATRIRRYVGECDAPADDATAFGRLCEVIFAQGLGMGVVAARRAELAEAFDGFDPVKVAKFTPARVRKLLRAPIIRNQAKIEACVENARRWVAADKRKSYLAVLAETAAEDDPLAGWSKLVAKVRADFTRLGDSAARQTLKRWGFFTAAANPNAGRALSRLCGMPPDVAGHTLQVALGGAAAAVGRDPYAVECSFALFASHGPCRPTPRCDACPLAARCPAADAAAVTGSA